MATEAEMDHVILWVDDSQESQIVKEIISQTGIEYEELTPDQADTHQGLIEPPILQGYLYRYSGFTLIQALAQNPYLPLSRHLELEREQYETLVKAEEGSRERFPDGISRFWPVWSVRRRTHLSSPG